MKNLAKLIIFFTSCFAVIFLASFALKLLYLWIDTVKIIPLEPRQGEEIVKIVREAFPPALYISVLLALNYTAVRKMPASFSVLCVFVLGCVFTAGVFFGGSRAEILKPAFEPFPSVETEPGLILTRSNNAAVLLKGSADIRGPRVASIPGRPLVYQEIPAGPNNTVLSLPALPFGYDPPWFVRSLGIDFSLGAAEMENRFNGGFIYFASYAFSLCLLLCSLRFIFEFSKWPLANIFLGALVFRLVLSLETFLNSREINTLVFSFIGERIESAFISPLIFTVLGLLFIFYTFLARLARPRSTEDA